MMTLNKQNQQSELTSSELTALVWISCHPVGPQLEDTLHVPSTPAEILNSNQTSPQTGPEPVSGCSLHSTLTGNWGAAGRGSTRETCLAPAGSSCRVFGTC